MTSVLVVEDSLFMQTVLDSALTNAGYDVLMASGTADAVDVLERSTPDVITMDVATDTGIDMASVDRLMSTAPLPVLMLCSRDDEQTTHATPDWGAVELLRKPGSTDPRAIARFTDDVVKTVTDLSTASVSAVALARATIATLAGQQSQASVGGEQSVSEQVHGHTHTPTAHDWTDPVQQTPPSVDRPCCDNPTIVIGASTGGPKIVDKLFAQLPRELDAKVLVVQHMPAEFTGRFADRLDAISAYDVTEALNGDRIGPGEALVAPGGYHLEVAHNIGGRIRVRLGDGERVHGVRPAIDVTMETAAAHVVDPLCGVVLTGMGRDGAAGIRAIQAAGGYTLAQDEATSPVFGIPRKAIETGCVDAVAPADALIEHIIDAFTLDGERHD